MLHNSGMSSESVSTRTCFSSGTAWEQSTGYSRVVRVGDLVFTAGTVAADESGTIHGEGCYEQCCYIFEKLRRALEPAGCTLNDVVRTVCYLTDLRDADDFCRAHGEYMSGARPAATCVAVSALFGVNAKVEIELTAVVGSAVGVQTAN
jgi:enamine deaminase RidA (YjgF/YER057c/UK114 family)